MNNQKPNILKESLENVFKALGDADAENPRDRLVHNILMTIERRREQLEWLVSSRSRKIKGRTAKVLHWALTEILWMDGVPAPAVVDAAVEFVKKRHSASEASFVNAFLRNVMRDMEANGMQSLFADAPRHVFHCLPEFLWKRWSASFGKEKAEQLATVLQQPAKVVLRRKSWPPRSRSLPDCLLPLPSPEWAPWAELYTPASSLKSLDGIMGLDSDFYIQDTATLLAPSLLSPRPCESVADLCAAPGGKSLVLAEMLKGRGHLLCADRAAAKLPRLRQNLSEIPNAEFLCIDASAPLPSDFSFDAIMLDVPCSNSGVIRRRPDVRNSISVAKIMELAELQSFILDNAANALKPSGRIVYSTCSIEPEENNMQVASFIERHPEFTLVKSQTILPDIDHDGAFAALLARTESNR